MKKYLYILGFAGTVLFTACSTADDLVAENPNGTPDEMTNETTLIVEASQNSEIPITLGVGQSRGYTRAPIDPDVDEETKFGKFKTEDGRYLGVFCLATGKQTGANIPSSISNCDWKIYSDNDLVVRLCNVPAIVDADGFKFCNTDGNIQQHYYYPMANWFKYNYYAYYPRQDDMVEVEGNQVNTISFTTNQAVEKYYTIDGSQDIIWGMANPDSTIHNDAPSDAKPFCAKYYRWRQDGHIANDKAIADYYPEMKFYHKLVQFEFNVKKDENVTKEVKVTDMYINNAIYQLQLIVANKKTGQEDRNGNLNYYNPGTKLLPKTSLGIKEIGKNNNRFDGAYSLSLTTDPQENPVGYILLPSPKIAEGNEKEPDFKYHLVVNFVYDGQPNVAEIEMNDVFDAGKKYSILVNVKSPLDVSAKAVLQEWDDSPAPITYNSDGSGS